MSSIEFVHVLILFFICINFSTGEIDRQAAAVRHLCKMSKKSERTKKFWEAVRKTPKLKRRPQDQYEEFGKYRKWLNSLKKFDPSTNPYEESISMWQPRLPWKEESLSGKENDPVIVDSKEKFKVMMEDVELHEEVAVDMEGHTLHSFYGMTMIIQIATSSRDYIVHVPSCFQSIREELKSYLESAEVIKVFHGGHNDVLALQRDFGIFIRGYVDTQAVYSFLKGNKDKGNLVSFKEMTAEILGSDVWDGIDTDMQMTDWRIHPLTAEMAKYAQADCALLLRCWQKLKKELAKAEWKGHELDPIRWSKTISGKCYSFPHYDYGVKDSVKFGVNPTNRSLFMKLHEWRWNLAKEMDESPMQVVATKKLQQIADNRPKSRSDLDAIGRFPVNVADGVLRVVREYEELMAKPWDSEEEVLEVMAPEEDLWETNVQENQATPNQDEVQCQPSPEPTAVDKDAADTEPPVKQYIRDCSSLVNLPPTLKTWKSDPPSRRTVGNDVPDEAVKAAKKNYQNKRRKFNLRRNQKLRKHKIKLIQQPDPLLEGAAPVGEDITLRQRAD